MKAKKYEGGGKMKKYSKKPMTPQEQKEFDEMMRKYRNTPSSPVGGEAQRTKYEERFMKLRDKFSKGGMVKKYEDGGSVTDPKKKYAKKYSQHPSDVAPKSVPARSEMKEPYGVLTRMAAGEPVSESEVRWYNEWARREREKMSKRFQSSSMLSNEQKNYLNATKYYNDQIARTDSAAGAMKKKRTGR